MVAQFCDRETDHGQSRDGPNPKNALQLYHLLRIMKLNAEKTQLMWLGSRHQLAKLTISQFPLATTASSSTVDIVSTANDLGVILDSQLTMVIGYTHLVCLPCRFFPGTSVVVSSPISLVLMCR